MLTEASQRGHLGYIFEYIGVSRRKEEGRNQEKDGSKHRQNMKERYFLIRLLEVRTFETQEEEGKGGRSP